MSKVLEPKFNNVIIEPMEAETYKGNIIVPDAGKDLPLMGKVLAVGPGKFSVTGEFIPTVTKVDQIVLIPKMGPIAVRLEGTEYYICSEEMIYSEIKDI